MEKPGTPASEAQQAPAEASYAPLPPRKETFLAHYPRNLKMIVVVLILGVLVLPWAAHNLITKSHQGKNKTAPETAVQGLDKNASNASPDMLVNNGAPASTGAVEALNEQDDKNIKMAQAPDQALSEDSAEGSLPRISEDGRQPWQTYARPFNAADKRPRIAIVITGLGLARASTDAAITRLPANVTLAFDVQSPVVGAWLGRARQDGHETLLQVPMEPFDYPRSDPGPNSLLTSLPNADNLARLQWALRQGTGYIGITTLSGSRFTTDPTKLTPMLEEIRHRGLMILDARVAPHSAVTDLAHDMKIPAVAETVRIDDNLSPEAIDTSLAQLEQTARLTGHAIGLAMSTPVMLDHLLPWLKKLPQDGIALAPISAMVQ